MRANDEASEISVGETPGTQLDGIVVDGIIDGAGDARRVDEDTVMKADAAAADEHAQPADHAQPAEQPEQPAADPPRQLPQRAHPLGHLVPHPLRIPCVPSTDVLTWMYQYACAVGTQPIADAIEAQLETMLPASELHFERQQALIRRELREVVDLLALGDDDPLYTTLETIGDKLNTLVNCTDLLPAFAEEYFALRLELILHAGLSVLQSGESVQGFVEFWFTHRPHFFVATIARRQHFERVLDQLLRVASMHARTDRASRAAVRRFIDLHDRTRTLDVHLVGFLNLVVNRLSLPPLKLDMFAFEDRNGTFQASASNPAARAYLELDTVLRSPLLPVDENGVSLVQVAVADTEHDDGKVETMSADIDAAASVEAEAEADSKVDAAAAELVDPRTSMLRAAMNSVSDEDLIHLDGDEFGVDDGVVDVASPLPAQSQQQLQSSQQTSNRTSSRARTRAPSQSTTIAAATPAAESPYATNTPSMPSPMLLASSPLRRPARTAATPMPNASPRLPSSPAVHDRQQLQQQPQQQRSLASPQQQQQPQQQHRPIVSPARFIRGKRSRLARLDVARDDAVALSFTQPDEEPSVQTNKRARTASSTAVEAREDAHDQDDGGGDDAHAAAEAITAEVAGAANVDDDEQVHEDEEDEQHAGKESQRRRKRGRSRRRSERPPQASLESVEEVQSTASRNAESVLPPVPRLRPQRPSRASDAERATATNASSPSTSTTTSTADAAATAASSAPTLARLRKRSSGAAPTLREGFDVPVERDSSRDSSSRTRRPLHPSTSSTVDASSAPTSLLVIPPSSDYYHREVSRSGCRVRWSDEEVYYLLLGLTQFGHEKFRFKMVFDHYHRHFRDRTIVDLKDKLKNLEKSGIGPRDYTRYGPAVVPMTSAVLDDSIVSQSQTQTQSPTRRRRGSSGRRPSSSSSSSRASSSARRTVVLDEDGDEAEREAAEEVGEEQDGASANVNANADVVDVDDEDDDDEDDENEDDVVEVGASRASSKSSPRRGRRRSRSSTLASATRREQKRRSQRRSRSRPSSSQESAAPESSANGISTPLRASQVIQPHLPPAAGHAGLAHKSKPASNSATGTTGTAARTSIVVATRR